MTHDLCLGDVYLKLSPKVLWFQGWDRLLPDKKRKLCDSLITSPFDFFQHATWNKRLVDDVAAKVAELEALKEARNVDRRLLGWLTLSSLKSSAVNIDKAFTLYLIDGQSWRKVLASSYTASLLRQHNLVNNLNGPTHFYFCKASNVRSVTTNNILKFKYFLLSLKTS